ncbi:unnamed protein product [Chironomus riparius]|uniref:Uncharacterized protein n=1 Tax=Chironomus riparius TaxID=315576 RepID=A0A9N9WN53_9DIPT|nr:unnamed protein product [Chironomus riparius]
MDNTCIDKIDSPNDLYSFLKSIKKDKGFKAKVVLFLFKNCPQGSANYHYFGVLKNVIKLLFTENFQNISYWGAPKKKSENNGSENSSVRVVLSQYIISKDMIEQMLMTLTHLGMILTQLRMILLKN